jgi:hypothetical protein
MLDILLEFVQRLVLKSPRIVIKYKWPRPLQHLSCHLAVLIHAQVGDSIRCRWLIPLTQGPIDVGPNTPEGVGTKRGMWHPNGELPASTIEVIAITL